MIQRLLFVLLAVFIWMGIDSSLFTVSAATDVLRPRPPQPTRTAPAPQQNGRQRQFAFTCARGHTAAVDPIVMPGHTGMSHMHQFFGNTTTNENSTFASLFAARRTLCRMRGDFSAYWVPSLHNGNVMVLPTSFRAIYRRSTSAKVSLPPDGLMLIAGNAKATTAQDLSVVSWQCANRSVPPGATPPVCTGSELLVKIRFPECWDGVSVDSTDHKSHVQYAVNGACAAGSVAIPQLTLEITYPAQADVSQLTLASGSILTMHADFFNAWSRPAFTREINRHLNR
jgi:hypothetical protein